MNVTVNTSRAMNWPGDDELRHVNMTELWEKDRKTKEPARPGRTGLFLVSVGRLKKDLKLTVGDK